MQGRVFWIAIILTGCSAAASAQSTAKETRRHFEVPFVEDRQCIKNAINRDHCFKPLSDFTGPLEKRITELEATLAAERKAFEEDRARHRQEIADMLDAAFDALGLEKPTVE